MKSIARVVHLPSVVQSEFSEATRTLFVCKENKNKDFVFARTGAHIQNEIYALDLPTSLDWLIDLAIRVDTRLQRRSQHRPFLSATDPLDHSTHNLYEALDEVSDAEPMQMGRSRLSPRERERC